MLSTSAGTPAWLTTIIALVFGFKFFLTSTGSIHIVYGSTSTIFDVQLFHKGTTAVVMNEIVGLMISQSLIPSAFKTKSCPWVALDTATAYFAPTISANSFSNLQFTTDDDTTTGGDDDTTTGGDDDTTTGGDEDDVTNDGDGDGDDKDNSEETQKADENSDSDDE